MVIHPHPITISMIQYLRATAIVTTIIIVVGWSIGRMTLVDGIVSLLLGWVVVPVVGLVLLPVVIEVLKLVWRRGNHEG